MNKSFQPYIILMGLMVLTSLALAYTVDVRITDEAGVLTEFPDQVGEWTGYAVRFCQNPECRADWLTKDLQDIALCPDCGSDLREATIAELDILPNDTVLHKKKYFHPAGRTIYASIVLSGRERTSIHRPEVCLKGQGNDFEDRPLVDIPLEDRDPLRVRVIEMARKIRAPNGDVVHYPSYYAYWFSGKGRETPYHVQRMVWMGTDRLFRNVAHRWAYISVSGLREAESEAHYDEIRSFVKDFYPQISLN